MESRWSQWGGLKRGEHRQLLQLALLQPMISIALRVRGYRRTHAWLERHSAASAARDANSEDLVQAKRLAVLANIAGRHGPVHTTCLRQALVVWFLLRRRGLRPAVKIGVDRVGDSPDMHAWVDLQGIALGQSRLRHIAFN